MIIKKIKSMEFIGFILILISFLLGDIIPTSYELRWTIITLFFVWGLYSRINNLEKLIKEAKDDKKRN